MERILRLFTDIRKGEAKTALLLTLNVFLIFTAYYIIKPVREALILAGGGAVVKSYISAGQAVLLLFVAVPLYGWLASRLPRRRLINIVTMFFAGCLVVFYVLAQAKVPLGIAFFLWVGIFNLMVVAQFWSFANDVYTTDEGKRLFPIVAFGASSGAVFGSFATGRLIEPLGVYQLMLVAGALLLVGVVITNVVDARERRRTEASRAMGDSTAEMPAATQEIRLESGEFKIADLKGAAEDKPAVKAAPPKEHLGGGNAFGLVFRNQYLVLIAFLVLILNWVNSNGEYILGATVAAAAHRMVDSGAAHGLTPEQIIGRFYSDFYSAVNLAGLVLQLFAVSRILKWFGVRVAIMTLPANTFTSTSLRISQPSLPI